MSSTLIHRGSSPSISSRSEKYQVWGLPKSSNSCHKPFKIRYAICGYPRRLIILTISSRHCTLSSIPPEKTTSFCFCSKPITGLGTLRACLPPTRIAEISKNAAQIQFLDTNNHWPHGKMGNSGGFSASKWSKLTRPVLIVDRWCCTRWRRNFRRNFYLWNLEHFCFYLKKYKTCEHMRTMAGFSSSNRSRNHLGRCSNCCWKWH